MYGFKLIFYFFEVLFVMTGFNDEQSQIVFTHQQLEVYHPSKSGCWSLYRFLWSRWNKLLSRDRKQVTENEFGKINKCLDILFSIIPENFRKIYWVISEIFYRFFRWKRQTLNIRHHLAFEILTGYKKRSLSYDASSRFVIDTLNTVTF